MKQYTVRTGQNIYDIALTLYGTVEGIFDLLISNEGLSMESTFSYGDVLNYHEEFTIKSDIKEWLNNNDVIVKNGEHVIEYQAIKTLAVQHISEMHPDIQAKLNKQSTDEQSVFWDSINAPVMAIAQNGQLSGFTASMTENTHLFVDWGDYSGIQILEGDSIEVEHCYKSAGSHKILMYGDAVFSSLDISDINGPHYPMRAIYASTFKSANDSETLNTLILTK